MPYKRLSRKLVEYLSMNLAHKLNYFPAKYRVSKYYSPYIILHQENLDFKQHCTYITGEYVQADSKLTPLNTNALCTLDCIYLRLTNNNQGSYKLLHLATNRVINCKYLIKISITKSIIE